MRNIFSIVAIGAALALLAAPAWGEPIEDDFWIILNAQNQMVDGGGTGFPPGSPGEWYYYENTDWWNQWFYDHPPDPNRYKTVDYVISWWPLTDTGFPVFEVAINYSTLAYPENPNQPPLPPLDPDDEDLYIDREVIAGGGAGGGGISGRLVIPDFNPEWVSIDVWFYDTQFAPAQLYIEGTLIHECIPEPSTMVLITGAFLAMVFIRRRR